MMKNLITSILAVLLMLSAGLNVYWYYWPRVEKQKGETVYLPGKNTETVIYEKSATAKTQKDYERKSQNAKELVASVKGIPDLENEKKITQLIATNMKLQLDLTAKDMTLNDAEKQRKTWEDKYNSVKVDNSNNTASVTAEVSPKIATVEKRDAFYKPKETYTVITSENPSIKFYGVESYQFKNPKQKDFVELNLKINGLYIDKIIIPYGGAELLFNPDGKIKPSAGYGYFYDHISRTFVPYWALGLQYNLITF